MWASFHSLWLGVRACKSHKGRGPLILKDKEWWRCYRRPAGSERHQTSLRLKWEAKREKDIHQEPFMHCCQGFWDEWNLKTHLTQTFSTKVTLHSKLSKLRLIIHSRSSQQPELEQIPIVLAIKACHLLVGPTCPTCLEPVNKSCLRKFFKCISTQLDKIMRHKNHSP